MVMGDGYGDTREALRALLDTVAPNERRELALAMGQHSLALSHDGDSEVSRALGMSLTLASVTAAHVAMLEVQVVRLNERIAELERQSIDRYAQAFAALDERLQRIEASA